MEGAEKALHSACSRVVSQFNGHKELCEKFIAIRDVAINVSKDAHLYDYPGVECNGFRYAVHTAISLMQFISSRHGNEPSKDLLQLVNMAHCGLQYFKKIHHETGRLPLNANGSRILIYEDYQLVTEAFQAFLDTNGMDVLCNSFSGFHLPKPEGPLLRMAFYYILPVFAAPDVWTGLKTFFDYRLKRKIWREAFRTMSVEHIKAIDLIANSFWVRKVCPLLQVSWFYPKICKTIHVPRQTQIKLQCTLEPEQGVQLIRVPEASEPSRTVRCRLLMQSNNSTSQRFRPVILHAHGGGFAIGSPDNHEMYTRSWAKNLPPGTAFVSVDYSLSPDVVFPEQLQQLLDVFLWLSDGELCQEQLGYIPNKIIFIGDSSGGLNLCALLVVIKDLEKLFKDVPMIFPSGILAIYPSFTVAPVACPSMFLSCLHPELSPPSFLTMQSAYMPFTSERQKSKSYTFSTLLTWLLPEPLQQFFTGDTVTNNINSYNNNNNNNNNGNSNNGNSNRQTIWWNQSTQKSMQRLSKWHLLKHPYASPLFCDDFGPLARTELCLFVVESDPILDHAIYLANKWQGKVSLHAIKDCIHAFLPMADTGMGPKYSVHRDKISEELNRLLSEYDSRNNNNSNNNY